MKLQIIQGTDTIATNNPDVAYLARQVLKCEFVSVEETEIVTNIRVSICINNNKFESRIVFGPKPKHVINVNGHITFIYDAGKLDSYDVELNINSIDYGMVLITDKKFTEKVKEIITTELHSFK